MKDEVEKLTDFDELEISIADALGYKDKLPVDKNLFDGGCLCHTYPKNSDRACGNHAQILNQVRNIKSLVQKAQVEAVRAARIDEIERAEPALTKGKAVSWYFENRHKLLLANLKEDGETK